ncbi:MAG: TetR/AcrR family transcriptional regulator [Clostridiales bacterium]|nr:TetR/AcrR family transcriptional regulator [Clostridiales bacterium]
MENQRIRISKTMLKTGLLRLLREKPLSQITVYELCKVSEINRTTFYKYYGSQEELLNEIEADFLRQLDEELRQVITQSSNAMILILQHLYDQRELFCLLVRSVPMQEFSAHLFAIPSIGIIFQNMIDESSYSETEVKYIRQFMFQGTFSVLYDWLNSEKPEPVEKIADVLGLLKSKL